MPANVIDSDKWMQHAGINRIQSIALLLFMGGFLGLLGWLLWGAVGLFWLLFMGAVGVWMNPGTSPRWVMRMYGATRIGTAQAPELSAAMSALAQRAELPAVPDLYYVPSRMLNAFAVGSPARSAVAVTDGLVRQLGLRELIGVLAHEVSHIRSNDLWVMGLADMFSRATSVLSLLGQVLLIINLPLLLFSTATISWWVILLLIFAPSLASLAQLALSRTREYHADLNAVQLTGDPDGLASALLRIEQAQGGWMERIFLPGRGVPAPSVLRTHPEPSERVERLMAVKSTLGPVQGLFDDRLRRISGFGPSVDRTPRWHVSGLWH